MNTSYVTAISLSMITNWIWLKLGRGQPELNRWPLDLQSNALPLSYTPNAVWGCVKFDHNLDPLSILRNTYWLFPSLMQNSDISQLHISYSLARFKEVYYWKTRTSGGTRTRNPRLRRPVPYPLGHRGFPELQPTMIVMISNVKITKTK